MITSRRIFLAGSASLVVTSPLSMPALAAGGRKTNLVVVMLRGGMDGLAAAPFIGDDTLVRMRPDISINSPMKSRVISRYPQLKSFKSLWDQGRASVFHATSIPYTGRSHFEGRYLMESGDDTLYDKTGWLGRALEGQGEEPVDFTADALLLRGSQDLDNFLPSSNSLPDSDMLARLAGHYAGDEILSTALETIRKRPVSMSSMRSRGGDDDVHSLARIAGQQLADPDGPSMPYSTLAVSTPMQDRVAIAVNMRSNGKFDQVVGTLRSALGDVFDDTIIVSLTELAGRWTEWRFRHRAWLWHGHSRCRGLLPDRGSLATGRG